MTPRVLIVDDELDGCWLTAFVLRRDPNLALAGEATDGEMALALVRQERPDVVALTKAARKSECCNAFPSPRLAVLVEDFAVRDKPRCGWGDELERDGFAGVPVKTDF